MVLTPEQEQIGRQNFGGAVAVTRRDFLSGVTAGAAGIGALYFGYEDFVGDPVRTGIMEGAQGTAGLANHDDRLIEDVESGPVARAGERPLAAGEMPDPGP